MKKQAQLTTETIHNAITYLRRVVAYGTEAETVIRTVEALEQELERRTTK